MQLLLILMATHTFLFPFPTFNRYTTRVSRSFSFTSISNISLSINDRPSLILRAFVHGHTYVLNHLQRISSSAIVFNGGASM